MPAGWPGKHRRDILEQLEPAVERSAGDHVERDIGIAVVDPVAAGAPGDHREDDHAETVDQARLEERAAEGEAAERAHRAGAVLLHRGHGLDRIAADQLGVRPGQRGAAASTRTPLSASWRAHLRRQLRPLSIVSRASEANPDIRRYVFAPIRIV